MTALVLNGTWVAVYGGLGLAALVPVVWAIVDVARRPPWQFPTARKVLWALTLAVGWFAMWPLALVASVVYLSILRRRFPPGTPRPQNPMAGPYGPQGTFGPYAGHGRAQGPTGQPGPPGPYGHPGQPWHQGVPGQPGGQPGQPWMPGQPAVPWHAADPYGTHPPPASLPDAGWYPDPAGSRQERWWDGRGWTDHLR